MNRPLKVGLGSSSVDCEKEDSYGEQVAESHEKWGQKGGPADRSRELLDCKEMQPASGIARAMVRLSEMSDNDPQGM
ncbi:hypothetical protein HAHE_02080 [Haloferula helveola]|uniref:Uncharacterized protein n=1 Tax=Haloferula helveola TaxID=490095 RepID=A0ABM7R9X6_9BACT|nr:hypothetical protein HAHE_02080 [Haloferula helveola]